MWCSNGLRRQTSPLSIEPEVGQRPENGIEAPVSESCDVLHEDKLGSHFANDSMHFPPEAGPLSCKSSASPSDADVLAWEAAADDVDVASPWLAVESPDVIPDREPRKGSVGLPSEQDSPGVGIKLNSASDAPSKQSPAQDAASCPCK